MTANQYLGQLYQRCGQPQGYVISARAALKAAALLPQDTDDSVLLFNTCKSNLAEAILAMGGAGEAVPLLKEAYEGLIARFGEQHEVVATIMNNLGSTYFHTGTCCCRARAKACSSAAMYFFFLFDLFFFRLLLLPSVDGSTRQLPGC